ncbi:hypothetical protein H8K90_12840 [Winogradskyella echinorum]|uniref:Por secretion system C-terminal sorting domain-containing protein n=1 Tax=Winogradskyella echinorum TaxID=538189 RepID=A0ABR6Y3F7_9FLAO|nr:hypothetical protein [Winogradskyella echinorum]MBC3847276.1 hypothetical protein [Winogradskyella echinorum]MBC5751624.1 hypothetical protein [Winogradskyella echinorum]
MTKLKTTGKAENNLPSQLYIAVDHLKDGTYQLNIMSNNTIVSSIKFEK